MENFVSKSEELNAKRANLYEALAKAQAEMPNAKFNKKNPHFGNRYADLASIREACRLPLSKNGLSVLQIIEVDEKDRMVLKTRLAHISGAFIESEFLLRSEKNTIQGFGSALTYAKRYSLASLLGIVADEDDDGEIAVKEEAVLKNYPKKENSVISKEQVKELQKLLTKLTVDERMNFFKWLQIEDLTHLPQSKFEGATKSLKAKLRNKDEGEN